MSDHPSAVPEPPTAAVPAGTVARVRSIGNAWDFREAVVFDGHDPAAVGGTVTLFSNFATAFLYANDARGTEIGRGYTSRFHATQALALRYDLPLPLRIVDEDLPRPTLAVPVRSARRALSPAQVAAMHAAALHADGAVPASIAAADRYVLTARGLLEDVANSTAAVHSLTPRSRITATGKRLARHLPRERLVLVPCAARKALRPVAPAAAMYTGSYHRAAVRAAKALTTHGGRWLIVSARYGLLRPDDRILHYDLRAGQSGTVSAATLRRQAHHLAVTGADVTVLAGQQYTRLLQAIWPALHHPLAGARGIGDHLAYFATLYGTAASEDRPETARPEGGPLSTA